MHLLLERLIPMFDSDNVYTEALDECASVNNFLILNFQFVESSYVSLAVLRALTEFAKMVFLVILISLMGYLVSRMKRSRHINIRKYICVIFLIVHHYNTRRGFKKVWVPHWHIILVPRGT